MADQSISLMDGTYFVGRKDILDWINHTCKTNLSKVEQTCTGAIACQLLDSLYPGRVPMSKVDWGANKDYEYIQNYKILQKCFTNLKIDKHIEVDRLVRGKYQDNFEFMQWFKAFYDRNATNQPYDAIGQREKGKGGHQYTLKHGSGGAPAANASPPTKRRSGAAVGATRAAKPPAAPSTAGAAGSGPQPKAGAVRRTTSAASNPAPAPAAAANPQLEQDLEAAKNESERLKSENDELHLAVEGLEKERDFYFSKLRDIEILLQNSSSGESDPLAQSIFQILYATDGEEAMEEGQEGDEM